MTTIIFNGHVLSSSRKIKAFCNKIKRQGMYYVDNRQKDVAPNVRTPFIK